MSSQDLNYALYTDDWNMNETHLPRGKSPSHFRSLHSATPMAGAILARQCNCAVADQATSNQVRLHDAISSICLMWTTKIRQECRKPALQQPTYQRARQLICRYSFQSASVSSASLPDLSTVAVPVGSQLPTSLGLWGRQGLQC